MSDVPILDASKVATGEQVVPKYDPCFISDGEKLIEVLPGPPPPPRPPKPPPPPYDPLADAQLMTKLQKEKKFLEAFAKTGSVVDAAMQVFDVGKFGGKTPRKSASAMGRELIRTMTEQNRAVLAKMGKTAIDKIEQKMEAKNGVYHDGCKIGEEDNHAVQLQAAVKIAEMAGLKAPEKSEIHVKSFFDAVVRVVEYDDGEEDGDVIDGELTQVEYAQD